MKSGLNYVIVKVDDNLVREIQMGKENLIFDPTYDVQRNTKISAEVVSVPLYLSKSIVYEATPGWPPHTRNDPNNGNRYPLDWEPEMKYNNTEAPEIEAGDMVYFHYLSLVEDNYINKEEGMKLYKIPYEALFCKVAGDSIQMLNGHIAVKPVHDESYEEVEVPEVTAYGNSTGRQRTIRVKQSSGIIYDINEKPIFRHGILAHRGNANDGRLYSMEVGDKMIYTDFSEFKNTIEGEEYYIMKLWDVLGIYKGSELRLEGDNVFMDVTPQSKSRLIIPDAYKKPSDQGTVLKVGPYVDSVKEGDIVRFSYRNAMTIDLDHIRGTFIKDGDIWIKKV